MAINVDHREILAISDPLERARTIRIAIAALNTAELELSYGLTDAVRELRQKHTTRAIAEMLGISQPRVGQIEHRGRAWKTNPGGTKRGAGVAVSGHGMD